MEITVTFLEGGVPPIEYGGHVVFEDPPRLDMTDGGFCWNGDELEEAVRVMRDRLFENNPELDEFLPKRAHLRTNK